MPDDTKLLACPFCGGTGTLDTITTPRGEANHFIRCLSCACDGPWAKTSGGAAYWWNLRTMSDQSQAATIDLYGLARERNRLRKKVLAWGASEGAALRLVDNEQCPDWLDYDRAERALADAIASVD